VIGQGLSAPLNTDQNEVLNRIYQEVNETNALIPRVLPSPSVEANYQLKNADSFEIHEEVEESLSLEDREKELIRKALDKHRGKRKYAANELGISERTLYRKIKEYNLTEL
jgi:transcriptional regulator with PAS, ATPase and Fis domain